MSDILGFLHRHPYLEKSCKLNRDHVIIDREDWEKVRNNNINDAFKITDIQIIGEKDDKYLIEIRDEEMELIEANIKKCDFRIWLSYVLESDELKRENDSIYKKITEIFKKRNIR